MPPVWQIRVKNPAGTTVAILDRWTRLRVTPTVNAPGGYELRLVDPAGDIGDLFALDGQLEFWRRHAEHGIDWRKEFEALHLDEDRWTDSDGVRRYLSRGYGYATLLGRRIIAAAAGSAEGEKSGPAETVTKEYVEEQAGPTAGARALAGLTVEADAGGGNAIALARSYKNLLSVCQEIAEIGGGDFSFVGSGPATFQFRWHAGQLGTDRRAEVRFALSYGNMGEPQLTARHASEANAVLVAGQGEGAERVTTWRTDATLIAASPWGRREEFVDARDASVTSILEARGDARLEERRPVRGLTFKVLQTPGTVYGRDYFLGDLVRGEYAGVVADQKIEGLVFTVDDRQERLEVTLRDA